MKQQNFHGEESAKVAQTAKDTFEEGSLASGLPEINLKKEEINKGRSHFRSNR